jgi:urease gamma subunit
VQLIVIGQSRKFAVIDGQVIKSGEILNESKIVDIKSGEVVTKDPSKSLKLNPSVEKKLITADLLRQTSDGNKINNNKARTKTIVIGNESN